MHLPKLMLVFASGGVLLGLGLAQFADPAMKFAPAPDRPVHSPPDYSSAAMQFVEAGPQDPSPAAPLPPGYAAGPFPAGYVPAYLPADDGYAEPAWDYLVEDYRADEAALDVAQTATETAAALAEPSAPRGAGNVLQ